jgi:hypothetical protein
VRDLARATVATHSGYFQKLRLHCLALSKG